MNKTKPKKFTFKNEQKQKGLASIGSGTPPVYIKYAGVTVGTIEFNNQWNSVQGLGIGIRLKVPRVPTPEYTSEWKWVTLKQKFTSGDEAKLFVNQNFQQLSEMIFVEKA
jgi:hypothetical protein